MTIQEIASQFGSFATYRKVSVTYQDLQATSGAGAKTITLTGLGGAGATGAVALSVVNSGNLVIPQGYAFLVIRMIAKTLFAGGALSALTASLGTVAGTTTTILAAQDVFGATAGTVTVVAATAIATLNGITSLPALTPTITFTPTGDSLSNATAGQVDVEFVYINPSTPNV